MNTEEKIEFLIKILLKEIPEAKTLTDKISSRRMLLRALMNVRPPQVADE